MISNLPSVKSPALLRRSSLGFTLVEVLVSMAILLMMLLIVTQVIDTAQKTWRRASARLSQFREARGAFDRITRSLSQATLNPYRVYDYGGGQAPGYTEDPTLFPQGFVRTTDLGFVIGDFNTFSLGAANDAPGNTLLFQAPLGFTATNSYRQLTNLLCVRGYYVLFGTDRTSLPVGLASRLQYKSRFRLYEYQPPTETNTVFTASNSTAWMAPPSADVTANSFPVAENIFSLILSPSFGGNTAATGVTGGLVKVGRIEPASAYKFNSVAPIASPNLKNQLPSSIQVVMMAMDEESATKIQQRFGSAAPKLYSASFVDPKNLVRDLKLTRESLLKLNINFRIFSTTVNIPAADN